MYTFDTNMLKIFFSMLHAQENRTTSTDHFEVLFIDEVTQYATHLALIEISLGAILHGLKIPFGGHVLSINQGLFFSHAAARSKTVFEKKGLIKTRRHVSASMPISISLICATLKSLSPAGHKLGPMLSISMQGFLFGFGQYICGANKLGIIISMSLLSIWAFTQPLLMLFLFFGKSLMDAFMLISEKLLPFTSSEHALVYIFLGLIIAKCLAASILGLYVFKHERPKSIYFFNLPSWAVKNLPPTKMDPDVSKKLWQLALRDLCRPFFLVSLIIMVGFLYLTQSSYEKIMLLILRPIAVGFIFFYLSRHPIIYHLVNKMRKNRRFDGFFKAFDQTLKQIQSKKQT